MKYFALADTMGWATPMHIECVLGEVRNRWPDMPIALHCTIRAGSRSPTRMPGSKWVSPNSTRP
jgi:hypothetical protein